MSDYSGWGNVRYVLAQLEQHTTSTVSASPKECERLARYLRTALRVEGQPVIAQSQGAQEATVPVLGGFTLGEPSGPEVGESE